MKIRLIVLTTIIAIYASHSNAGVGDYICYHNDVRYGMTRDPDYCPPIPYNHMNHSQHNMGHVVSVGGKDKDGKDDKDIENRDPPHDPDCYVHAEYDWQNR